MSLKNKVSLHDLVQGTGNPVGDMSNQQGGAGYNTQLGTSNSPFSHNSDYPGLPSSYPNQDHLVNLLNGRWSTMDAQSTRVGSQNTLTNGQTEYMGHNPTQDHDLEGNDKGNGVFTQGHLAPKQIAGVDLHVHLLTGTYSYQHGRGGASGLSLGFVGPSPGPTGNSDFQDFQVAPGAVATDFSANFDFPGVSAYNTIAGKYNENGPSEGFY
tara:strand:- start:913 stop:1545 length:633 start_codon:yes stop_codon:yes gene_type:complete